MCHLVGLHRPLASSVPCLPPLPPTLQAACHAPPERVSDEAAAAAALICARPIVQLAGNKSESENSLRQRRRLPVVGRPPVRCAFSLSVSLSRRAAFVACLNVCGPAARLLARAQRQRAWRVPSFSHRLEAPKAKRGRQPAASGAIAPVGKTRHKALLSARNTQRLCATPNLNGWRR